MPKTTIDRSNTSFSLQLFEHLRHLRWGDEYSFLKYFQNVVRLYFLQVASGSRGLLVMHEMGVGKTIQAISIAIDMMGSYSPIILSGKSLRGNMIGGIKKYVSLRTAVEPEYSLGRLSPSELDVWIAKHFTFVSSNAGNMANQLGRAAQGIAIPELESQMGEISKLATLNGKLIIVDEAHNLFRAITNGGKNGLAFYEMMMRSENVRILFLTGTPINSDPFELVPCFNMLAGAGGVQQDNPKSKPKRQQYRGIASGSAKYTPLFPETYREFTKLYVDPSGGIKNKGRFQNRIQGMISYISRESTVGAGFGGSVAAQPVSGEFPEEYPMRVVRVHMSQRQYMIYTLARDKEHEENSGPKSRAPVKENPSMTKPKSETASTYRVRSRQYSNFASPGLLDAKTKVTLTLTSEDGEIITEDMSGVTTVESPKYSAMLANVAASPGVGLVYSQFVGAGGLGSFSTFLEQEGWSPRGESRLASGGLLDEAAERPQNIYAVISGAVSVEERAEIQDAFNSAANRDGSVIRLLLVSATGAEGLDLHRLRHIHIMEPYWNYARIAQIIARGVRNNSHLGMEADEKNVQPYIYLSIPPTSETAKNNSALAGQGTFYNPDDSREYLSTTDVELYQEAVKSQITINSFIAALTEVCIECVANAGKNCRVCAPSNEKIFTDNAELDSISRDPCSEASRSKIQVKPIEHAGLQYYYLDDSAALYDYKIYIPAEDIGGFKELPENDPRFEQVLAEILSQEAKK